MHALWTALVAESAQTWSLAGTLTLSLGVVVLGRAAPETRSRLRTTVLLWCVHLVFLAIAAACRASGASLYPTIHLVTAVLAVFAFIGLIVIGVFDVALPRVGVRLPHIMGDVLGAGAGMLAVLALAGDAGFNLSGLIATSAVLTAVVGLSIQDTLANLMGGLALQTDRSIRVGDWIVVDDDLGRVADIRWRFTSLETPDGELMVVPNGQLVRGVVRVVASRDGQRHWRRWVHFQVDFRHPPHVVIEAVEAALCDTRIEGVALEPKPRCVLDAFEESFARYGVSYWITAPGRGHQLAGAIRVHLHYALKRAHIPLALPAEVHLNVQHDVRRQEEDARDRDQRHRAIGGNELFSHLPETDQVWLAEGLETAPYAEGDSLTHQGDEEDWLYLVHEGTVVVRVRSDGGGQQDVATLSAGSLFGEMSLMTGEPRSATVVAVTDVEGYRLTRSVFQELLSRRPAVADEMAEILASRRVALLAAHDDLDREARQKQMGHARQAFVHRIRTLFGLDRERA
jgi:small-conductance mechanosensitive channel